MQGLCEMFKCLLELTEFFNIKFFWNKTENFCDIISIDILVFFSLNKIKINQYLVSVRIVSLLIPLISSCLHKLYKLALNIAAVCYLRQF